jgi:hypothetical protein
MTLRFRRSVRVFPGVRLNFSSSGVSTTIGGRGASLTVGPRGTSVNVGLPHTGVSFHSHSGRPQPESSTFGKPPASLPEPSGSPTAQIDSSFLPGEIRSAENEAITSVGLRAFLNLLVEANRESHRLKSELPSLQGQLTSTQTKAYKWQNGVILKHLLRERYATILSDFQSAQKEVNELKKSIEQCRVAVEIEMSGGMDQSYGVLVEAFRELAACDISWDTTSEAAVDQVKERSHASRQITRTRIIPDCRPADVIAPSRPSLRFPNANGGDLYILPGLLLIFKRAEDFALINLREVRLTYNATRFQEEEGVPSDSRVTGHTWKKVNKDGSPDRRFSANDQIPIAEYGILRFISAAGLNEEYMFSNAAKVEKFRAAFAAHQAAVPL